MNAMRRNFSRLMVWCVISVCWLFVCSSDELRAADRWLWAKTFGGWFGTSIGVDGAGNSYVLGFFDSQESVGGILLQPQTNYANGFLVKYDPSGNLRWVRQVGVRDRAMHVDSGGNTYLAGYVAGKARIGSVDFQSQTNRHVMFVARYDTTGDILWARKVGEADSANVMCVAADNAGAYYLAGSVNGRVSFEGAGSLGSGTNGMFVAKFRADGILVWKRIEGGGNTNSTVQVDDMVVSDVGECFIMGRVKSVTTSTSIGGTRIDSRGSSTKFLAKLTLQGEFEWVRELNATVGDLIFWPNFLPYGSLALDEAANIYVVDNFLRSTLIANTALLSTNASDFYMAKFDRAGNFVWLRTGGTSGDNDVRGIAIHKNGDLSVTGLFSFSVSTNQASQTVPIVRKYDQSGNLLGEELGTGGLGGNGIALDQAGNVFLTGGWVSPPGAVFGQIHLSVPDTPRLSGFIAKLRPLARAAIAIQLVSSKEVRVSLRGFEEAKYRIETYSNLVDWVPFLTWPGTNGSLEFSDFPSPTMPAKFYRVISVP